MAVGFGKWLNQSKEEAMALQVREQFVDLTRGCRTGDSDWYETWTNNIGRLFKSLQKEHGRCRGRIYQDTPDGSADPIGWVFEKVGRYSDTGEPFRRETWVTVRQV